MKGLHVCLQEVSMKKCKCGESEKLTGVIGTVTKYLGHEERFGGYGIKMLVTAVFKRKFDERLVPDRDTGCDFVYVSDNDELQRLGGLDPTDSVEVQCWHPRQNRWCVVYDEIKNIRELDAFKNIR